MKALAPSASCGKDSPADQQDRFSFLDGVWHFDYFPHDDHLAQTEFGHFIPAKGEES